MSDREPALLRDQAEGSKDPDVATDEVASGTVHPADDGVTERTAEPIEREAVTAPITAGAPVEASATTDVASTDAPAREDTREAPEREKATAPRSRGTASEPPARSRREAPTVYVVGFWKRLAAAAIDLAIVIPAALIVTFLASKIAGVHLPPSNLRVLDVDMWIDLVLAIDPALIMGVVLTLAIGMAYLLVFHIAVGRTLGMRVLNLKIIDVYGDPPSPARCIARCGGYLAGVATLFLGFLWMGFDSEKRGLQDWIAGTYVIRA
jgi:uncharacterized RDD family membrane protein YckC